MFPFSASAAVFPYSITAGNGKLPALELARLHDLTADRFLSSRVPESLDSSSAQEWGWCWWLDSGNPVSINRWVLFGIRQWTKKPPANLQRAMLEERVKEAKEDGTRVNKDWKQAQAEDIERLLTIKTPPNIEETPVVLDTVNGTLWLYEARTKTREAILGRLRRILEPVYGKALQFTPWNLHWHLRRTRPDAVLPVEIDKRWISWVAGLASTEKWMVAHDDDGTDKAWGLVLDDKLRLDRADGELSVSGDGNVADTVRDMLSPDNDNDGDISRLKIWVANKQGSAFRLLLDSQGNILRCSFTEITKFRATVENLDEATLDRCEWFAAAADLVRLLIQAFDNGPLEEWMDCAPQRQLWPGVPPGGIEWLDADPWPDHGEQEQREENGEQRGLFSDDVSITMSGGGRDVTVTGKQFDRAVKNLTRDMDKDLARHRAIAPEVDAAIDRLSE